MCTSSFCFSLSKTYKSICPVELYYTALEYINKIAYQQRTHAPHNILCTWEKHIIVVFAYSITGVEKKETINEILKSQSEDPSSKGGIGKNQ